MPTTNLYCNHDARVAQQSGSTNLGSGASDGLPFGLYGAYRYRALLAFPFNFTGWTAINSAFLYVRTSNQIHVAFGGSPTMRIQRMHAGGFTEGTSDGLSGSNAVVFPGPAGTTVNQVASGVGSTESTWRAINITAMMRDALAGNPIYGLLLTAWDGSGESNSASHVGEIYSRESGSAAYIAFDYATNTPPNAPTVTSPSVSGGLSGTQTPTLDFLLSDPQADTLTQYQWQIDDNSDFSSPLQNPIVSGSFANNSHQTAVTTTLTRGTTYYVRAQAYDGQVWGAWSATYSFKVASLPTVTVSEPSAAGRLGHLWYVAGSGWVSPRLEVDWALTCPDGGSQYSYRVEVQADSAGSPSGNYTNGNDSTTLVDSSTTQRIVPADLTEGNYYHVQVTATCSHGLSQTVAWRRVRVRWGVVSHRFDMGAATGSLALTILDVTDETNGGSGRAVVEYQTTTTTAAPGSYSGTIGGAGLNRYLWYRTWLLVWGASPAVSPSFNEIKITYTTATISPDKWTITDIPNQSGDVAAYVYGTKSLRLKGTGAPNIVSQAIPVAPNTYYVLSGRVQSVGNSGAYIDLATSAAGGQLVLTAPKVASVGFEHPDSRVVAQAPTTPFSIPWYSGNNTQVFVRCVVTGAVGTTGWFDALKVEASTVVTPWTPGYVANAVVLDAGGLQIDAANGGIFRLRGLNGGVRDTVDLGAQGLVFGGDTNLISPAKNVLQIPDTYGATDPPVLRVGDDAEFWDVDLGGSLGLRSVSNPADGALYLGTNNDVAIYRAAAAQLGLAAANGVFTSGLLSIATFLRHGGTSFPGGPATNDRYFRTDLRLEFIWDGSRWLTTEVFHLTATNGQPTVLSASGAVLQWGVPALLGCSDIWMVDMTEKFIIAGGTALSGSVSWTLNNYGRTLGDANSAALLAARVINSGAVSQWRQMTTAINALLGPFAVYAIATYWTKLSTPGNLTIMHELNYRLVAT